MSVSVFNARRSGAKWTVRPEYFPKPGEFTVSELMTGARTWIPHSVTDLCAGNLSCAEALTPLQSLLRRYTGRLDAYMLLIALQALRALRFLLASLVLFVHCAENTA